MRNLVILIALMPALMVACDKKSKRNPAAMVDEVRKDKDLQRTFQSECRPVTLLARVGEAIDKVARTAGEVVAGTPAPVAVTPAPVAVTPAPAAGTPAAPVAAPPAAPVAAPPAAPATPTLQAQLLSDEDIGALAVNGVQSVRVQYKFAGNRVTRTTISYAQADCVQEAWIFQETGRFKIDEKQKSNDGGRHIDLDFDKLTLTVRDDAGAKAANEIKLCNKADWSANSKEQTVNASSKLATCYKAEVPRKIPHIYRIDNDQLYLGKIAKPGERPSILDWGRRLAAK